MARYWPSSKIAIAKPCGESWAQVRSGLFRRASMAFLAVMLVSASALAQTFEVRKPETEAILQGNVIDPTGAAIPHARVKLEDGGKKPVTAGQSDAAGYFALKVAPGVYTLKVAVCGFQTTEVTNLELVAGEQARAQEIRLQLGKVTSNVEGANDECHIPQDPARTPTQETPSTTAYLPLLSPPAPLPVVANMKKRKKAKPTPG